MIPDVWLWLAQGLQIGHQIVDVRVSVLGELLDVCIDGRIHFVLHGADLPGAIGLALVAHADGEFIEIGKSSGNGLSIGQGYGDFALDVAGVEHAFFELQALEAGGNAGEVAGWGVAFGAVACSVEVLLAGVDVAGLEVCDFNAAAMAVHGGCGGYAGLDEGDEIAQLLLGEAGKGRHSFFDAAIVDDLRDFGAIGVSEDELGTGEIGTSLAAHGVAAVAEGAVLLEDGATGGGEYVGVRISRGGRGSSCLAAAGGMN